MLETRWIQAAIAAAADIDELLGLCDACWRPEEKGIRKGEDDAVGGNANGNRDRCRCGDDTVAAKHPQGIADVAPQIAQSSERSLVAAAFLRLRNAAERDASRASGFFVRQTLLAIAILEQGQVCGELAIEVAVGSRQVKRIGEPAQQAGECGDHSGSLVRRRLTSSADRCQRSICSSRARVPALVIP